MTTEFRNMKVTDDLHKITCFRLVGTRILSADTVMRKIGRNMYRQHFKEGL